MSSAVVFLLAGCGSSEPDLISCSDAAGEAGGSVTLSCQANGGVSGLSLTWKVTAPNGSDVAVLENGLSASFTPASVGTYYVKATAVAGDEMEVERFVANIGNPKPTVSCPSQLSVKANRSIIVDCTASDHANRELAYQWTLISPAGVTAQLTTNDEEDAVFTPPAQGTYSLTVTVTAPDGKSATADVTVNAGAPGAWRIVAIGDSITQSNLLHPSYRYRLWKKLLKKGISFDLVGSQNKNSDKCIKDEGAYQCQNGKLVNPPDQIGQKDDVDTGKVFDPDHEGYWGKKTDEVLDELRKKNVLPVLAPDVALVHLGTNDIGQGQTVGSAIANLKALIGDLQESNPNVTILVAKIIPYSNNPQAVTPLNNAIAGLASRSTETSKVIIVDQYSGFDSTTDTFDGVHPNDSGEEKIARKFFNEIDKIIK